jgi:hypothetical protein
VPTHSFEKFSTLFGLLTSPTPIQEVGFYITPSLQGYMAAAKNIGISAPPMYASCAFPSFFYIDNDDNSFRIVTLLKAGSTHALNFMFAIRDIHSVKFVKFFGLAGCRASSFNIGEVFSPAFCWYFDEMTSKISSSISLHAYSANLSNHLSVSSLGAEIPKLLNGPLSFADSFDFETYPIAWSAREVNKVNVDFLLICSDHVGIERSGIPLNIDKMLGFKLGQLISNSITSSQFLPWNI